MYHVIGGDGKEYGPVTTDQLRQWVTEGRANAQSQVRPEGSADWRRLGSLPELAGLFNAPPAVPQSPGTMGTPHGGDYELDIFGCLNRAWNLLLSNFWLLVGGGAIYLLIIGGLSGFAQVPFIGILFSIVSLVIAGPLLGGVYVFYLRVMRHQHAEIGDVFLGFGDNLGQLILGHLIPTLIAGACAIPGVIMAAVPIMIMVQKQEFNPGFAALAVVGVGLFLAPTIYLTVSWTFTLPLIADRRLDFWPAMKASRAQVGRHWWTVFGLIVVAGLVNFAGLLVCCVGTFVTMPVVFLMMLLAYEILFGARSSQPGPGA
jgi:hypothetical protein